MSFSSRQRLLAFQFWLVAGFLLAWDVKQQRAASGPGTQNGCPGSGAGLGEFGCRAV